MDFISTVEELLNKSPISPVSYGIIIGAAYAIKVIWKSVVNRRKSIVTGGLDLKHELSKVIRESGSRIGGPQIYHCEVDSLLVSVEKFLYQPSSLWLPQKAIRRFEWLRDYLRNLKSDLNQLPHILERLHFGMRCSFPYPLSEGKSVHQSLMIIHFISEEWNSVIEAEGYEDMATLLQIAQEHGFYLDTKLQFPLEPYEKLRKHYLDLCSSHYDVLVEYNNRL